MRCKRTFLVFVSVLFLFGFTTVKVAYANEQRFYVSQARSLAQANSPEIKKQYNKIVLKRMKYVEAVKAIKEKVRNLTTFRWTPLFGFHFPEKLNMTETYDLNIKPLVLQMEISVLTHQLNQLRLQAVNSINQTFIEVYVSQEKNSYSQKLLEEVSNGLERNKARLLTGAATQNDIDTMERSVKKLTSDVSMQKKNLENAKKKLSDLIGLDVTTGYIFENPFVTAIIDRKQLEEFINYTLQNDQAYFEAKMAETTALLNLNSFESLMKSQYGYKMDHINSYINMAKWGMDIDYSAFQIRYKTFLDNIDEPWRGYWKILFFKFPKEWMKGEISGTRYIEDEMYAVYTACMEYASAKKEKDSAEKNIRKEIENSFDAIVSAYNAYLLINEQLVQTKSDLKKMTELNKLGKVEYSELNDKQEDYASQQLDALDALAEYNQLLFHFDYLTCGAVQKYMKGESLLLDSQSGGDSFAAFSDTEKPYYYIYEDIDNMLFVFGLNIPENFEPEITHYELWYENTKIGVKMEADSQLRHLALDYGGTSMLTLRLYDADKFVDETRIDANIPRDILQLKGNIQKPPEVKRQIGSYRLETTRFGSFPASVLTLEMNPGIGAVYYSLSVPEGTKLFTEKRIPIEESFTYLTALSSSLNTLECTLYDKNYEVLYHASFDTASKIIFTQLQP